MMASSERLYAMMSPLANQFVYDGFHATSTITRHEWLEEEMEQAKMVSWALDR